MEFLIYRVIYWVLLSAFTKNNWESTVIINKNIGKS